ncbi:MAG: asparagine--tRNA ligase [Bacteroidia bacterium]|nr:MAG: asparagine--tRNA ligase [Bacteroidia bacterium]
MKRTKISEVLKLPPNQQQLTVMGWVRTFRNNQFISLNDGSTIENLQIVVDFTTFPEELLKKIHTGTSLKISGKLVPSQGKNQTHEIIANTIEILGECDPEKYPLQPKKHSLEFLREIAHLRMRTTTFQSIFRIRNGLAFAIHQFFQNRGFVYIHSPIITASDAEGAGELFQVTTLDLNNIPKTADGLVDYTEDFFGKPANLTVSGQLEAELGAMAFSEVYTFGPTFRAENSNTPRHLAEFWMIEPEMAFYDLNDNMDLAEEMLKYLLKYVLDNFPKELEFLQQRQLDEEKQKPQNERSSMPLIEKLQFCIKEPFERLTYTKAIEILENSSYNKKKKFQFPVQWGMDLQTEHERYLVEKEFNKPVILTDYPKDIKAFYMRQNDDGKTVRAMDILFPGIGEIIGGSQREERLEILEQRMKELNISTEEMYWYLDTRRFGTVPHAGFGLGFERLVQFCTGMSNIRDVIPFPRTPKNCEF